MTSGGTYDRHARQRWAPEPPKRHGRSPFERDRARLLHSSALRRLAAKTQVVGPGSDDFVRNRLTHSLEVAQVGRELGAALGCDPDVVDAACLAHDLGHPPFGHNGESALDEIASDIGGFEGNAQTLRVLTRLEPKVALDDGTSVGLNLTRASLDAACKYPWLRGEAPDGSAKFGVYAEDVPVFSWLREGAPAGRPCVEAQVMDLADDVAYCTHDVEDAIVAGWLDPSLLAADEARQRVVAIVRDWYDTSAEPEGVLAALDRLRANDYWVGEYERSRRGLAALKNMTSQLIGRFAGSAEQATREAYGDGALTRHAASVVVPFTSREEITVLKGVAAAFVMTVQDRQPGYVRQREQIAHLVEALTHDPSRLEPSFADDWAAAPDDAARLRVVIDQVASLTDPSALAMATAAT